MNAFRVAVLLFVSAVAASFAEGTNTLPTTITVDRVTYSNITWRTVTLATVSIMHSTGAATIPLEKLPPELQQRFNYNPDRARQYRNREAELDRQQQRQGALQKLRAQNLRKVGNKLYDFRAIEHLLREEQQSRKSGLDYSFALEAANKYGAMPYLTTLTDLQPAYDRWSGLCSKIHDCKKFCVVGVVRSVREDALLVECKPPYFFYITPSVPISWDYAWVLNYPSARSILLDEKVSAPALWTDNRDGKRVYDCGVVPNDDELLSLPVVQIEVK